MKYESIEFVPGLRVPVATVFDRIVWIIVGYWFNLFGPLFLWRRWRRKNSYIGKMAVRWALLGTVLNIITLVVYYTLF